jgi:hypothetical protein
VLGAERRGELVDPSGIELLLEPVEQ